MQILTFQDASTWDVSPDTGFITFASPEDAKKAEALFNAIQAEAKSVVKDAERYRWLAAQTAEEYDGWWIDVHIKGAKSLETMEEAIDAAMASDSTSTKVP
jgi:hypothetical protein